MVSVRLQRQTMSLNEFVVREKEKMCAGRETGLKVEPVILTAEEKERRENERRTRLCAQLEGQLVDALAKAEHRRLMERDEDIPTLRLSSDQISAKLSKIKLESKRREPALLRTRNLPILSLRLVPKWIGN